MYQFLLQAHSGFRYLILILLITSLLQSFGGWLGSRSFTKNNKRMYLFTMVSVHIQLLIGIVLYFVSDVTKAGMNDFGAAMKNDSLRYWTIEHWVMMVIAIALITIGYSRSKKELNNEARHRSIAIFYLLAFIVIIVTILLSGRPLVGMGH